MHASVDIDADALCNYAEETRSARRFCSVLWGFVFASPSRGLFSDGMGLTLSIIGAFITTLLTLSMGKPTINERLERPRLYRFATGLPRRCRAFGIAIAAMPAATESSQILAVYFGLVAVPAIAPLVSRGAAAVFALRSLAMVLAAPVRDPRARDLRCRTSAAWTEAASAYTLGSLLLALPVLAIVALVSFGPRHDFVPDARAIRRR